MIDFLFLAFENPWKSRSTGGSEEIRRRVELLASAGARCSVLAVDRKQNRAGRPPSGIELRVFERRPSVASLRKLMRVPLPAARRYVPEMGEAVRTLAPKARICVVEGLQMSAYLEEIEVKRPEQVILRAHNIESDYHAHMAHASPPLQRVAYSVVAAQYRQFEHILLKFDSVHFISSEDLQRSCALYPDLARKSCLVPPIARWTNSPPAAPQLNRVAYFGDLSIPGNVHGLQWFLQEVWPRIKAEVPDAELFVAGRGSERFSGPHINVCGFVPDIQGFIWGCDILIQPLFHGGGVKIKLLDGVGLGRPVVATPRTVEGTVFVDGSSLPVSDNLEDYADAVVAFLRDADLARRSAALARERLRTNYSPDAFFRAFEWGAGPTIPTDGKY